MFKGLGGLANLGSMLKQAQQLGSRMKGLQDELRGKRALGAAGGGLVEFETNGLGEVLRVSIADELIGQHDREMLEDLVCAAANQAQQKARQLHEAAMREVTSDMNLPGLDEALSQLRGNGPSPGS